MTYSEDFRKKVLQLIADGLSYHEIADRVGCSKNTVYNINRENHPFTYQATRNANKGMSRQYCQLYSDWISNHASEPMPNMVIEHDQSGTPTVRFDTPPDVSN